MTRDDIMHLVNETAPRYQSWGCEAHFQLFAKRLLEIERETYEKRSDKYEELQRDAGLANKPTPFTYALRCAVNGEGPRASEWQDKPHRLLFDACDRIEAAYAAARGEA